MTHKPLRHVTLWLLWSMTVTLLAPGRRQVAAFQTIRTVPKKSKTLSTSTSIAAAASSRREILLSSSFSMFGMFLRTPSVVNAASTGEQAVVSYQGVYSDPQHPRGYRILVGDSQKATLKLTNGGPNSSDMYEMPVKVKINKEGVQQLTFDFSQKGGLSSILGLVGDDNSIIFPGDTPPWTKITNDITGVYKSSNNNNSDLQYDYVSVWNWKGAEWKIELMKGSGDTIASFGAKAGSQKGYFEYPGEFNKAGFINREDHTISFRDGIVWTRF